MLKYSNFNRFQLQQKMSCSDFRGGLSEKRTGTASKVCRKIKFPDEVTLFSAVKQQNYHYKACIDLKKILYPLISSQLVLSGIRCKLF